MPLRRLWLPCCFLAAIASAQDFTSRELNFSIAQVPFEKSWTLMPQASSAEAISDKGEQFTIWASPAPSFSIDERWVRALVASEGQNAARQGSHLESVRLSGASSPVPHSYRFSYAIVAPNGGRTLVDGYAAAAGRAYVLKYVSEDRASIELFRSLVASFRVRDRLESYRGGGAPDVTPASLNAFSRPVGRTIAPNGTPTPPH